MSQQVVKVRGRKKVFASGVRCVAPRSKEADRGVRGGVVGVASCEGVEGLRKSLLGTWAGFAPSARGDGVVSLRLVVDAAAGEEASSVSGSSG